MGLRGEGQAKVWTVRLGLGGGLWLKAGRVTFDPPSVTELSHQPEEEEEERREVVTHTCQQNKRHVPGWLHVKITPPPTHPLWRR